MGKVSVSVEIQVPVSTVWSIITDIPNSPSTISGIEKVEILEQPEIGLVGLKWRETRIMFGKSATEIMWITRADELKGYQTRAESHGAVYISEFTLHEQNGHTTLTMSFDGQSSSFSARLMEFFMGWMFKKATLEAIRQDLEDIKAAAERIIQ